MVAAVAFLTRWPVSRRIDEQALASAVVWFPAVGALVGAVGGVVLVAAASVWPMPVASFLAVLATVAATGALHEDGLADTADALGGYDTDQRLAIMKDSRVGTFGTVALVSSMGLRVVALASFDPADALLVMVAMNAVGRAGAVALMATVKPVAPEGLGAEYVARLTHRSAPVAVGAGIALVVALVGWRGAIAVLVAGAALVVVATLARRWFGGVTGDVLGAAEQTGEITVALTLAALVGDTTSVGWW